MKWCPFHGYDACPTAPRPTIKSCASEIKRRWPFLDVKVDRGYCNTDRKPKGFRYITKPGKGRWGARIVVRDRRGKVLLEHNNAETYRRVCEVLRWMESFAGAHGGASIDKLKRFRAATKGRK